jgi:endonuclease G
MPLVRTGGYGSKETIAGGRVYVPTNFWKVIVLLRAGNNDLRRITRQTRVIAVDMPNDEGLSNKSWRDYLTTVDDIESATGYDFLSKVSETVQNIIEARKDAGREAPARRVRNRSLRTVTRRRS